MAMVKLEPPARAHNISSSAYSYLIVFIIFGSFLAMTYLIVLSDYSLPHQTLIAIAKTTRPQITSQNLNLNVVEEGVGL